MREDASRSAPSPRASSRLFSSSDASRRAWRRSTCACSSRTCTESAVDTRESGRGLEGVLLDDSAAMRSEMSLLFNSRSDINGASTGVCGPLRDTERLDSVVFEGEGGGGIAIALGIRARGVLLKEGRDFEGVVDVGMPMPIPLGLEPSGLGVLNGELRVGDESCREGCTGEPNPVDLVGLIAPAARFGLPGVVPASCFAVIPTYLAALEPGVILVGTFVVRAGVTRLRAVVADGRGRAEGVCRLSVLRPVDAAGVTRPLPKDGVTLPLEIDGVTLPLDIEGVFRPLPMEGRAEGVIRPDAEKEGVMRPLRTDATDDGRDIPTVAADSFVKATKTPQLGGHVKYCLL